MLGIYSNHSKLQIYQNSNSLEKKYFPKQLSILNQNKSPSMKSTDRFFIKNPFPLILPETKRNNNPQNKILYQPSDLKFL